MSELADVDLGREPEPESPPPRRDRRKGIPWLLVFLVAAAGFGAFLWWQLLDDPAPPPPVAAPPAPAPPPPAPAPEVEPEAALELPALDDSDDLLRELIAGLADHPRLARWLAPEGLVRRFVAAVDNVAEGLSPRKHLPSLAPTEGFKTVERDGGIYPAAESFARYDGPAAFVASLDAEATAALYRSLEPLFDEAYRDLGYPDRDFRQTLDQGIQRLLRTPVPSADEALVQGVLTYEFADPKLENLSGAQRQFLRMGPANVQRVQAKLREVSAALGL